VLLDTSGRYLSQTDTASATSWRMLLKLISRQRRHTPLNGVLVNLPVTLLLADDPAPLEELARQVRQRLQEIQQHLRCQSPVYLVLSKADEIRGFNCFFEELDQERSREVLGINCEGTSPIDAPALQRKFDHLLRHLGSRVMERAQYERQPRRVARIIDFPQRLGAIVTPLIEFVEQAFGANRYQPASPLRGVFLTSAPHTPVGKDSKTADAPQPALNHHSTRINGAQAALVGHSRFIHDLFSRVMFSESGLATLERRQIQRIRWSQATACVAALSCSALIATYWAQQYIRNEERIAQLGDLGKKLALTPASRIAPDDAFMTLPELNTRYAALEILDTSMVPLLAGYLGLDQRFSSRPVLQNGYRRALENQLLPSITRQLENQIRASLGDRRQLLDALRSYLMLADPAHFDAAFLSRQITLDWRLRYGPPPADQARLAQHLSNLLKHPVHASLDQKLIERARNALRTAPVAELAYQALKEQTRTLPEYRLDQYVDPQGILFSGTDYTIPGLYTKASYQRYFLTEGIPVIREQLRDNWVLGDEHSLDVADVPATMIALEQLYLRDYADYWAQALSAVTPVPVDRTSQVAEFSARLTAADSPLLKLLAEVRKNTLLLPPRAPSDTESEKPETASGPSGDGGKLAEIAEKVIPKPAYVLPENARMAVQLRFAPLHQLLDEQGNPGAQLTATLQALNELHLSLAPVSRASQPEQAAFELARSRMNGQPHALGLLRTSSARLPHPLGDWFDTLADDGWRLVLEDAYRHINLRYQDELYSVYDDALAKRYPFEPSSMSDVAISDFRDFFKVKGTAERFHDSYLKPFLNGTAGSYSLRSVDGRSLPVAMGTLGQMNRLERIRRSFFSENPDQPLIKFRIEPYSLDQNLSRADFRLGNQHLEYRHGPIVPIALQWPIEADNGVASLVVEQPGVRSVGYQEDSGPWSLFRLIERMDTDYHIGRDVLMFKAEIENRRVNYLLMSQRSPNPFMLSDLRGFRLPQRL
jgi:type VI secretion system protein ImpL